MPETTEGLEFDENGICRSCASSEQKMHINWEERRKKLDEFIKNAKNSETYKLLVDKFPDANLINITPKKNQEE